VGWSQDSNPGILRHYKSEHKGVTAPRALSMIFKPVAHITGTAITDYLSKK